jgi:hypothetical protein
MFREHSRVQKELESMRRSQRELQDQIRALDISLAADRYTKKLPMYLLYYFVIETRHRQKKRALCLLSKLNLISRWLINGIKVLGTNPELWCPSGPFQKKSLKGQDLSLIGKRPKK